MFLKEIYQLNKRVCLGILIFMCCQLGLTFIQLETTPFLLWGMYSQKLEAPKKLKKIHIKINNQSYNYTHLPLYTAEMITIPLFQYNALCNDSELVTQRNEVIKQRIPVNIYKHIKDDLINNVYKKDAYNHWLKTYLENVSRTKIEMLEIEMLEIDYTDTLNVTSKKTILNIK